MRKDGATMHFDILVPEVVKDELLILEYGQDYLRSKPFGTLGLRAEGCSFCHIEKVTDALSEAIANKGYAIIEMENCD